MGRKRKGRIGQRRKLSYDEASPTLQEFWS
jgi:hypothetical protein